MGLLVLHRAASRPALAWTVLLAASLVCADSALARQVDSTEVRYVDIQADSLVSRRTPAGDIVELLGVLLTEGSTQVRSDRMVDQGGGLLLFNDNVRVIDESDTLTARSMLYNRNTKIGRATGDVRLGDGEVVVTAPEGDYDANAKRADFRVGVTMVDSASTLTSLAGSYWTEEKRADFYGSVMLVQDSLRMAADSLVYLRETRRADARGQVVIERETAGEGGSDWTWVFGDRALNDEAAGTAHISGRVLLVQVSADSAGAEPDTLWITSMNLVSTRSDSLEHLAVSDSVVIWQKNFAAVADSASYRREQAGGALTCPDCDSPDGGQRAGGRRHSRLFGGPVAWFRTTQISGDTLLVTGRGSGMDTLFVRGNAFVAREDTATAFIQQLQGRQVTGLFRDDSLRTLIVAPNAQSLYRLEPSGGEEGGAVATSGDRILFTLDGDDVTDIRIYQGVEGTYYPANLVTDELRLDGWIWVPERRPRIVPLRQRFASERCRLSAEDCPDVPGSN